MKVPALVAVLGAAAACDVAPRDLPARDRPWVTGLADVVSTHTGDPSAASRMHEWSSADPDCVASAYPGFVLTANVAPAEGRETVLASYAQGLVVLDRRGKLLASTPGYRCEGSRDDIELLAAGDAHGEPTIALVATGGGRAESATWVALFRVADRRIDAVFTGTVEVRRGAHVQRGSVALFPDSLIYTRPGGKPQLMVYDPIGRAYLVPGEQLEETDHDGPMVSDAD